MKTFRDLWDLALEIPKSHQPCQVLRNARICDDTPQKKTLRKKNALPGLRSAAVNKLGFVFDREMRTPPQAQQQGSQSHNASATNKQIATKCHDPKGDDDELKKKTKTKK